MKTLNIDGLTIFEIKQLIQQGGKFIYFPHTLSAFLKTFKINTNAYFIRPEESAVKYSLRLLFLNITIGWWRLPLGPISMFKSFYYLIIGGKDVTFSILEELNQNNPVYSPDIHYLQFT